MNLLISILTNYTEMHGTMSIDFIDDICRRAGWKALIFSTIRNGDKLYSNDILTVVNMPFYKITPANKDPYNIELELFFNSNICKYGNLDNVFLFQDSHLWRYIYKPIGDAKIHAFIRIFLNELDKSYNKILTHSEYILEHKESIKIMCESETEMINSAYSIVCAAPSVQNILIADYGILPEKISVIESFSDKIPILLTHDILPDLNFLDIIIPGRNDLHKGSYRLGNSTQFNVILHSNSFKLFSGTTSQQWEELKIEWYNLYTHISFVAFPAFYETRGLLLQEAMALGKVVLVSADSAGLSEQVTHGYNGFIIDFDSNWEDQLKSIICNYDLNLVRNTARNNIRDLFYKKPFRDGLVNYLKGYNYDV